MYNLYSRPISCQLSECTAKATTAAIAEREHAHQIKEDPEDQIKPNAKRYFKKVSSSAFCQKNIFMLLAAASIAAQISFLFLFFFFFFFSPSLADFLRFVLTSPQSYGIKLLRSPRVCLILRELSWVIFPNDIMARLTAMFHAALRESKLLARG